MMLKVQLTEQEQMLVKKVCELQLNSFTRILNGQHETGIKERLLENQLSESELNEMISDVVRQYHDILLSPLMLFHDHSDLLANFREALDYNIESLTDFSTQIPSLERRLDLAIYIFNNRN
jgi:hypothetical protein